MMMRRHAAVVGLAVLSLSGCGSFKDEPPPPFEIAIRVDSDPGRPLPGAVVMKGGKEGPSTGPDGRVTLKISGAEGETVDLMVKCPPEYVSPTRALTVLLRRITGGKLAEYDVSCPPSLRRMVVAVRADNGPNLPVMYLGKPLARTDATGAATLLFQLRPGEQFDLELDTSEKGNERIRPKSPSASFVMRPFDDIVTFDQKFSVTAPPHVSRPAQLKPREIKARAL